MAGAAQARADDALGIAGGEAAVLEALGQRQHVVVAEGVLELGERAKREAEAERLAVEARLDLAAVGVGHGGRPVIPALVAEDPAHNGADGIRWTMRSRAQGPG